MLWLAFVILSSNSAMAAGFSIKISCGCNINMKKRYLAVSFFRVDATGSYGAVAFSHRY